MPEGCFLDKEEHHEPQEPPKELVEELEQLQKEKEEIILREFGDEARRLRDEVIVLKERNKVLALELKYCKEDNARLEQRLEDHLL